MEQLTEENIDGTHIRFRVHCAQRFIEFIQDNNINCIPKTIYKYGNFLHYMLNDIYNHIAVFQEQEKYEYCQLLTELADSMKDFYNHENYKTTKE